jgi:hypothetical protein
MKRPRNRRSFTYILYCDLVCEAKLGVRKKTAVRVVAERRNAPVAHVWHVWTKYMKPNMIEAKGQAVKLW